MPRHGWSLRRSEPLEGAHLALRIRGVLCKVQPLPTRKVPDCKKSNQLLDLSGRPLERSSVHQHQRLRQVRSRQVPGEGAARRALLRTVPGRHLPTQAGANRSKIVLALRRGSHFATVGAKLHRLRGRKVPKRNREGRRSRWQAGSAAVRKLPCWNVFKHSRLKSVHRVRYHKIHRHET